MNKIDINGITINYQQTGHGKPLILLHGNGEDLHIFDKLIDAIKDQYTVYAIDSRNHGLSSMTSDYSYEAMSKDILCFIKALALENVSILGFSDGGIVALMLALQDNSLFGSMMLLGINLKPTDFKAEIYKQIEEEYNKTKNPLIKLMLEQSNIELDSLRTVTTPTLLIVGEDDLFPLESFQKIVATMPNASLKIVEGHDHGSYIVNNDFLAETIKSHCGF